ncbi:MAG TPA: hypothetical protein VGU02_11340 [Gaiellaceae bacterium]|nr:hypothetical protein [Gaiellaceae bacterium]
MSNTHRHVDLRLGAVDRIRRKVRVRRTRARMRVLVTRRHDAR